MENYLKKNKTNHINKILLNLKKIFQSRIYLEIQRHNDELEENFERYLIQSSKKLAIPLIASQEIYYLDKEMHEAHDALSCIR